MTQSKCIFYSPNYFFYYRRYRTEQKGPAACQKHTLYSNKKAGHLRIRLTCITPTIMQKKVWFIGIGYFFILLNTVKSPAVDKRTVSFFESFSSEM